MNADLHCHSTASDGALSPLEVARLARAGGVTLWSLTDHDELGGQHEARTAAQALDMHYVGGVEISVTWAARTVHIVGLNVNAHCLALAQGLARIRTGRTSRGIAIGERLATLGMPGAWEGALRCVSNADLVSRTHFARFMVEAGYATSVQDAFTRWLGDGKPGYVAHQWATLADAVGWILAAGGVPVVAHPGRYAYTPVQFDAFFSEFIDLGGLAIEVVTGSHTPAQYAEYAQVARRYGFEASRGSDFHAPGEDAVMPGSLPPLPAGLKPVWARWV
jgi:predicted metal-dependent phosphoesterase TrpH